MGMPSSALAKLPRGLMIAAVILFPFLSSAALAQMTQPMPQEIEEGVLSHAQPTQPSEDEHPPTHHPGSTGPEELRRQIERLSHSPGPSSRSKSLMPRTAVDALEGLTEYPDEVVIELAPTTSPETITSLNQRYGLATVERLDSRLSGTVVLRSRISDSRTVATVVQALAHDAAVIAVQPNFLFSLQDGTGAASPKGSPPLQYSIAKLDLPKAHTIARGEPILIGMIDTAVDVSHPDLQGTITASLDAILGANTPAAHGTGIASMIAAHGSLTGAAPAAHILAVQAFDANGARGSTFAILKGLDWTAAHGARVINMSFAGPSDPAIHRALAGAHKAGIVLVAAAGNAGPNSPPLYPAADPVVIAVTATDVGDRIFGRSNRGSYITLAAPGVDLLVAMPDGGYAIQSGTSFSAAEVSGIAALIIERRPQIGPDAVRSLLLSTARPLGQASSAPRLVNAWRAITTAAPASSAHNVLQRTHR